MIRKLVLMAAVGLAAVALAEDPKPASQPPRPGAPVAIGDLKPTQHHQAALALPSLNRLVAIHQADATDAAQKGQFFYRPPLAFLEAPAAVTGYPPIVHKVLERSDGSLDLHFVVIRNLPELAPRCVAEVAKDGLLLKASGVRRDQVRVGPWPMVHMVVEVKCRGEVLATGETDSLLSVNDTIEFQLAFTPEQAKTFAEKQADVKFHFAYSWSNRTVVTGEVTSSATKTVREAVTQAARNTLTERQRKGEVWVFANQKNNFERADGLCGMSLAE